MLINIYMDLARKLGWAKKELVIDRDRASVREVIEGLEDLKSVLLSNPDAYIVLVNGINIRLLKGFDTEIAGDSVLDIFPPAGGG